MTCTEMPQQLKMPLTSPEDVDAAELVLENDALANNLVLVYIHIVLHQLVLGMKELIMMIILVIFLEVL